MLVSRFDVAVLGAGPAGSVAACLLALRGLSVVLLEREGFPRFHIGESLTPHGAAVLATIGLTEAMGARYLAKRAVRFLCCRTGREQRYGYDEAIGAALSTSWQVPRADFDALLRDRAIELGVSVKQPCEVEDVFFENGFATGVRARYPDGAREGFLARVLIDATGRSSLICSRVGRTVTALNLDNTAFFAHFQRAQRQPVPDDGTLDLINFPHGWIWISPLGGEVSSIGAVVSHAWVSARRGGESLESFFDRTLDDAPIARELLSCASRITPVRAVSALSYASEHRAGDGWLSVGDAAGFIDPIFGSGTTLALGGAALAAGAIAQAIADNDVSGERFARYAHEIESASALYLSLTRAMYSGELGDSIFEARSGAERAALASVFAGDVFGDDPPWRAALRAKLKP